MKKKFIFLLLILLSANMRFVSASSAADVTDDDPMDATRNFYTGQFRNEKKETKGDVPRYSLKGLRDIVLPDAAKWITGFLAALAIVMIMYSGYQFLTAGGEQEKIASAAKTSYYVLAGIFFMIMAYAIVYLFLTLLTPS